MLQAFEVQETGCIRYKGCDRVIQMRLISVGEGINAMSSTWIFND